MLATTCVPTIGLALTLTQSVHPRASSFSTVHPRASSFSMMEQIPSPDSSKFQPRTAILGLVALQSALGLASDTEIVGVIKELTGQAVLANDIDYFGTIVDSAFVAYGGSVLLNQAGIIKEDPASLKSGTLNNMEVEVTLDIGREPGTWMPKDWAASGTRLPIPVKLQFSDEIVDLGFPGEEALSRGGSRYAKRVYCKAETETAPVPPAKADETPQEKAARERAEDAAKLVKKASVGMVTTGAWCAEPSSIPGASTFNFFLDFADDSVRSDVTLPAGRVFFSGAYWEGRDALPKGIIEGAIDMPDGQKAGVVAGPGGVFVLNKGSVTIKRNDWRNLFGALGEVMLIVGRFTAAAPVPPAKADETPQEKAARERAEDAARGRLL